MANGAAGSVLNLELTPTGAKFADAIARGAADEIAAFGARGDRKTFSLLIATCLHANVHLAAGHPGPVKWMGVMDYFSSHKTKTHDTLKQARWQGLWRLSDGGHLAHAVVDGRAIVEIRLMGIEDQGAIDRVRAECHCAWFEEVAPAAALVTSAGISEAAWGMALSSRRLPTHAHVSVITTNYPDSDHWSWRRFVTKDRPGDRDLDTLYFRIPPGEAASPADRAAWARALATRPDLLARLVNGQPDQLHLGDPVTPCYQEARHRQYEPAPYGLGTVWLSWDAYHHPACVVATIGPMGQLRVHFGRRQDNSDVGRLAEEEVIPWLSKAGLLDRPRIHTGDPTAQTGDQSNREMDAVQAIQRLLPGPWRKVTNEEEPRTRVVNEHLRRMLSTGDPAVLVAGPEAQELHTALSGGWHIGKSGKPVSTGEAGRHSHVGNAMAYLCLALFGDPLRGGDTLGKYANQSAYTQAWDGQPEGQRSVSPAVQAMATRPGGFDPAKWRKQYEE